MTKENNDSAEITEDVHGEIPESSNTKGCLKGCFLTVFIPIIIIVILGYCSQLPTEYRLFGKKRTAIMEKYFGITVTDEIKLKKYYYVPSFWLDDNYEELTLTTTDYQNFLDNINSKVKEVNTHTHYSTETEDLNLAGKPVAEYEYVYKCSDGSSYQNYDISVYVYKFPDDDFYTIKLAKAY